MDGPVRFWIFEGGNCGFYSLSRFMSRTDSLIDRGRVRERTHQQSRHINIGASKCPSEHLPRKVVTKYDGHGDSKAMNPNSRVSYQIQLPIRPSKTVRTTQQRSAQEHGTINSRPTCLSRKHKAPINREVATALNTDSRTLARVRRSNPAAAAVCVYGYFLGLAGSRVEGL